MDFLKTVMAPAVGAFFSAVKQNKGVIARIALRRLDGAIYATAALDLSPLVEQQVLIVLGLIITGATEGGYAAAKKYGWAT